MKYDLKPELKLITKQSKILSKIGCKKAVENFVCKSCMALVFNEKNKL